MLKAPSKAASPIKRLLKRLEKLPIPSYEYFKENDDMYHSYGRQFSPIKTYKEIVSFFREMLDKKIFPSPRLLSKFINRLINISDTYEDILEIYCFALNRGLANVFVVNAMIDAAGWNGEFEYAKAVFQEAKDLGLELNDITYNALMHAAGINGDLNYIKGKHQEIKKERHLMLDAVYYGTLMGAASKANDYNFVKSLYQETQDNNIPLNDVSYDILIYAAAIHDDFPFLRLLWQMVNNNQIQISVKSHVLLISAFIKDKDFTLVKDIFESAQHYQKVFTRTQYTRLIDAAIGAGNLTLAEALFSVAIESNVALDVPRYSDLLKVAFPQAFVQHAELYKKGSQGAYEEGAPDIFPTTQATHEEDHGQSIEITIDTSIREAYSDKQTLSFPSPVLKEEIPDQKLSISIQLREPSSQSAEAGIKKSTQSTDSEVQTPRSSSSAYPIPAPAFKEEPPVQTVSPQPAASGSVNYEPSIFSSGTSHSGTHRRKSRKRKSNSLCQLAITSSQPKQYEPLDPKQYAKDLINAWLKEEQVNPQDKEQAIKTLTSVFKQHGITSKLHADQKDVIKTLLFASLYHGIWDQLFCRIPYRINCASSAFSINKLAGVFGAPVGQHLLKT